MLVSLPALKRLFMEYPRQSFPILILSWVDIAPATLRLPGICFCPQESLSISPFRVFLDLGLFARGDGQLDMVYD